MDLKETVAPIFKWWWLIVAATLLAAVSSFLAVRNQPSVYSARTTIMIGRAIDNPNPSNNEFSLSQQLAASYADIANREPLRDKTKAALGLTTLPEYRARALPNSQLVEFVVTDTSPERAQIVANELANQLILQGPTANNPEEQERQAFVNEQLNEMEIKIPETQAEIRAKQDELEDLVSARDIRELQAEIDVLQAKLSTLQSNYASLLSTTDRGAINTLTVLDPAALPTNPVGPNKLFSILTASAIAFLLSTGAAYLLEYLDSTVKSSTDISRLTGLPTLMRLARFHPAGDQESRLVTLAEGHSPAAEAFRTLRTSIQFQTLDRGDQISLLVTSPNAGEGKSVTAANLAIVLAQAGYNVLLVDADLRRPTQHRLFGLSNEHGLSTVLRLFQSRFPDAYDEDELLLEQFVQPTSTPGLAVLTSGPLPPHAAELLGSAKMKLSEAVFSPNYDYIVLDSPPCLVVTDPIVLSTQVSGVVLVAYAGMTGRAELKMAVDRLREVNARVLGVTLNRLNDKEAGYYYYYSYHPPTRQGPRGPRQIVTNLLSRMKRPAGQPALRGVTTVEEPGPIQPQLAPDRAQGQSPDSPL